LVVDRLPVGAARLLSGATPARALDVVGRNRVTFRLLDRIVECGIVFRFSTPLASGDLDALVQPGEQFAAFRVDRGFLVFGGRPLGVAGHVSSKASRRSPGL